MRKTCVVLLKVIITFSHLIADFVAVPNILLYENGKTYDASLLIQEDGTIAGVQKMVHIAQVEPSEMFEWELWVQTFHNSVILAMCNRAGREGEMDFSGESMVVDANGNVMTKASDEEQIIYVEVDLAESREIRRRKNYTNLRRTELYK